MVRESPHPDESTAHPTAAHAVASQREPRGRARRGWRGPTGRGANIAESFLEQLDGRMSSSSK